MRVVAVVLTASMFSLAGCTAQSEEFRPGKWDDGAELLAHSTARYHSGGFDARVFPDGEVPEPRECVAYRADRSYSDDSCDVIDADSEHWFPVDDQTWGLHGKWQGRGGDTADLPDPSMPRILVAFAANGTAIAYWDGAMHPDASIATE